MLAYVPNWLAVFLIFGILYIFLIPPFQAPDEAHHLYRAYHLSDGNLFATKTDDQRLGGTIPHSLFAFAQAFRPLRGNQAKKTDWATIKAQFSTPLNANERAFYDFPNVGYYAPFGYAPAVVAVSLGKIIHAPPIVLLYLARLFSYLVWAFLMCCALRQLPFQRHTFWLLMLLPASLVFHAGLNPDALTNALCFVLIASVLRLVFTDKPLTLKGLILIVIISLIILLNKVVYAPLILLLLLIPPPKFNALLPTTNSKRRTYLTINSIILFIHAAVLLIWYQFTSDLFIPYDEYHVNFREDKQLNPEVNPLAQLQFILTQPLQFAQIFYDSYVDTLPWTIKHYFGKFGWEANYLAQWNIDLLFYCSLAVGLLDMPKKIHLKWMPRLAFIAIGIIMVICFSVVIYMQWSPPEHPKIRSLSGRYFIPIFPLFYLALYQSRTWIRASYLRWGISAVLLVSHVLFLLKILERYYS